MGNFFKYLSTLIERNLRQTLAYQNLKKKKHYWQDDHVRLYGLDYGNILSEAGFEVVEDDYINTIDPKLVERYALPKGEIIYFCKKTA